MTTTQKKYSDKNLPPCMTQFYKKAATGNSKELASIYKEAAFKPTAHFGHVYGYEGAKEYFDIFFNGKNKLDLEINNLYISEGGSFCGEYIFKFVDNAGKKQEIKAAYTYKGSSDGSILYHHSSFADVSNSPKNLNLPINSPKEIVDLPDILKEWEFATGFEIRNHLSDLYVKDPLIKPVESSKFVIGVGALSEDSPEISGAYFKVVSTVEKCKGVFTGSALLEYDDTKKERRLVNFGIEVVRKDGKELIASQHLSFGYS